MDLDAPAPAPTVSLPHGKEHTHTFIFLHGRGDTGSNFARCFARTRTWQNHSLQALFPSLKIIYPCAPVRKSSMLGGSPLNQWFDISSLAEPWRAMDQQVAGLKENVEMIQTLVREEAAKVGIKNVIIGGLSQGCATALTALLGLDVSDLETEGQGALGGFIGIAGWLPQAKDIQNTAMSSATTSDNGATHLQVGAARCVQDTLSLPPSSKDGVSPSFVHTPCLLGHGTHDFKVVINHGETVRDMLKELGSDVTWTPYHEWGHWWKEPETMDDIAMFFTEKVGMVMVDPGQAETDHVEFG
ncbi:alpha/beta-hydrolase [Aulographum hederae CBS 113979]|uniref:Alpha/beta-hydrolase n=1 Tax=Aulographum hederae CBS 113979 TaxID=1176131 RepID=A0A6G1HET3_9PEZI|nr:alpha/beta-hydrolase [Aulographum hederae CBS 113979]